MGCHSWFYAHLPEKELEWESEFIQTLRDEVTYHIRHVETEITEKDLNRYAKYEVENNQEYLKNYQEAKESGDISDYIEQFGSKKKLEKYIKSLSLVQKSAEEYRKRWIKELKRELRDVEKLKTIEDICKFDEKYGGDVSYEFGQYIIKDNKIYRNTNQYRDPNHLIPVVFKGQFYDVFRISNYDAEPCYSLEETLERCKENNVDWNNKNNDKDRLILFWNLYPDGIIEFG